MPISTSASAATLPAFATAVEMPSPPSLGLWAGWLGVCALVAILVTASGFSTSDVHAVQLPLPFFPVAVGLAALVAWTWRRGVAHDDDTPVARRVFASAGVIVFYAWLSAAFLAAFSMNWGADPFLLQMVETFHHLSHAGLFLKLAAAMATIVLVTDRPWASLVAHVVLAVVCSRLASGALVFSLIVVSARVCAKQPSSRSGLAAIVVVTILATAHAAVIQLLGYGGFYGEPIGYVGLLPRPVLIGAAIACVTFGHARWREQGEGLRWFVVAFAVVMLAVQAVLPREPCSFGPVALLVLVAPLRPSTIVAVAVVFVVGCAHVPGDVCRHALEFVLCAALCATQWSVMRRRASFCRGQ